MLETLRRDDMGKSLHADKIEEAYHEELDRHELCEKCNTGIVLHGPYSKVFPKYCVRYSFKMAYVFVQNESSLPIINYLCHTCTNLIISSSSSHMSETTAL